MPGVPVHFDRPPFNGRLLGWGRADYGWWGLVEWAQACRGDGKLQRLEFSAWLPASSISRPNWASRTPADVTRLRLGPDRSTWPPPPDWRGWFAGAWPSGDVSTPPGFVLEHGPAWRRR